MSIISLATLKILLTPQEMKNVLGGSTGGKKVCHCDRECICGATCSSDSHCQDLYGPKATCGGPGGSCGPC